MTNVTFSKETLERLRKAYEANKNAETFTFDGMVLVPRYAFYLIEYLDNQLNPERKVP